MAAVDMIVEAVIEVAEGGSVNVVARAEDGTAVLITYPFAPDMAVGDALSLSVTIT